MNTGHAFVSLLLGPLALAGAAEPPAAPSSAASPPPLQETPAQRDARMAWWREARFGLFVHWGAYARLGGEWNGKRIDSGVGHGIGEWIMYNAKIPVADYAREAALFNPAEFDAGAWVRLAKDAGQKYLVITAKHHDGFAMFHSKASAFNIVDHTAFKRDPIAELAAACRKEGVRLGFYYSQAQDWHHPGGAAYKNTFNGGDPGAGRWDRAQEGDMDAYLDRVAAAQVQELLTNYGPVPVFWWDTPVGMNDARAARLAGLLALQPGIITNNRLNDRSLESFRGDTETPEQTIPPTGFKDRDFEVCMTMNDTWGFKRHDQNWKPAAELIRKLVDVASKGGNFLLNVGPDELGRIPQPSVERLQAVGRWMRVNGEAIHGTQASPFAKLPWGRCTRKPGILYFHVFDWPKDGRLVIPGLKTPPRAARLLAGGPVLRVVSLGHDTVLELPGSAPDASASVIRAEFAAGLEIDNRLPRAAPDGTTDLPLWMADIHNPGYGGEARLDQVEGAPAIVGWSDPRSRLAWTFETAAPGRFDVVAALNPATASGKVRLHLGPDTVLAQLPTDGKPAVLGTVSVPAPGIHELSLRPIHAGWQPAVLRTLQLRPAGSPPPNN